MGISFTKKDWILKEMYDYEPLKIVDCMILQNSIPISRIIEYCWSNSHLFHLASSWQVRRRKYKKVFNTMFYAGLQGKNTPVYLFESPAFWPPISKINHSRFRISLHSFFFFLGNKMHKVESIRNLGHFYAPNFKLWF